MINFYCGVKIHFSLVGDRSDKIPTILLHGWGVDSKIFSSLCSSFPDQPFVLVDFPPFGRSDTEPEAWSIYTYANMVISLCQKLNISKANFLGHSFGGRVAIIISALYPQLCNKLVLVDSAGLKPKRSLKYYFRICSYKLKKSLGLPCKGYGSSDYKSLSPAMQKVFVGIVNEYLENFLPLIQAPTLIIFGENDDQTPLYMAKKLHKNIKNSRLEIISGGHFCFLDSPMSFYKHIDKFLFS